MCDSLHGTAEVHVERQRRACSSYGISRACCSCAEPAIAAADSNCCASCDAAAAAAATASAAVAVRSTALPLPLSAALVSGAYA